MDSLETMEIPGLSRNPHTPFHPLSIVSKESIDTLTEGCSVGVCGPLDNPRISIVSDGSIDTLTEGGKVYVDVGTLLGSPWCLYGDHRYSGKVYVDLGTILGSPWCLRSPKII